MQWQLPHLANDCIVFGRDWPNNYVRDHITWVLGEGQCDLYG